MKGSIENENIQELHKGIKQIQSYLLGTPYTIEEARLSAAKAAFITTVIKNKKENWQTDYSRLASKLGPQERPLCSQGSVRYNHSR